MKKLLPGVAIGVLVAVLAPVLVWQLADDGTRREGALAASGPLTTVVRRLGPSTSIPANGSAFAQVSCESGEVALGGGGANGNSAGVYLKQTYPIVTTGTPTGWGVSYENTNSVTRAIYAYAVCAAP